METHFKIKSFTSSLLIIVLFLGYSFFTQAQTYKIVDTDQSTFYDTTVAISQPSQASIFYGQDAMYDGFQPSYTDHGDGTVTDNVTGLMWTKTPDRNGDGEIDYDDKMSYDEAIAAAETFSLAGYDDWRVPSIKESYSLIMFSGVDVSGYEGSTSNLIPFINTDYFDFAYGDESAGERIIDAQFVSSTLYVGTTMNGAETMFGVNLADGRIKGYPTEPMPGQTEDKQFYVLFVRGNTNYGINDFQVNGDGTITDNATGLMWMQDDNGEGLTWTEALNYAENADYAGYNDWRLPNAKELQSIVDYTRAPSVTNSPAIDPLFNCSVITDEGGESNYPFYWTSSTHANWTESPGEYAAYIAFGEALGWMEDPMGNYELMDVHGAGAQRSDPKVGNPDHYPYGHGPQGDVIRIYNYVRLVRGGATVQTSEIENIENYRIYPNPANEHFWIKNNSTAKYQLTIYNSQGTELLNKYLKGNCRINTTGYKKGIYLVRINDNNEYGSAVHKLIVH